MEYRILGRTGLKVGAIALGCEGFADKTAEEVRADFDFAIRNGIKLPRPFTPRTPSCAGNIGAELAGRREKFVIQGHLCSVWEEGQYLRTRDPEKSLAAFEDLLARLGTDYVEIGMIHYVDAEADLREVLDGPIMRLAQRLRSEGRIRHIGLSSHNPVVAHMAARTGRHRRADVLGRTTADDDDETRRRRRDTSSSGGRSTYGGGARRNVRTYVRTTDDGRTYDVRRRRTYGRTYDVRRRTYVREPDRNRGRTDRRRRQPYRPSHRTAR